MHVDENRYCWSRGSGGCAKPKWNISITLNTDTDIITNFADDTINVTVRRREKGYKPYIFVYVYVAQYIFCDYNISE